MNYFVSERFSKLLIFIGVFLLLTFLATFLYKSVLFDFSVPIKTDVFGQFGDIVGGVIGSLWALAGVILFYAGLTEQRKDIKTNQDALEKQISALNYQKEEMELQRLEYKMARLVFEEQREALREQAKTSRIQQFESNFYALLGVYIDIRNNIFFKENNFIADINNHLKNICLSNVECKFKINKVVDEYLNLYLKDKDKISHYLKTVYRIYKVIDEQYDLSLDKKYFYSKIVRSQFMDDELFLIYYNAHSSYGVNFRGLIIKYNILKHLMVMSKVEFNYLNNNELAICNSRYDYLRWIDLFLIDNCAKIYDIENINPGFSSIYKNVNNDCESIIEMIANEEENIELIFTNNEINKFLGFQEENDFVDFIVHYLYDRIMNSYFKKWCDSCLISFESRNNDLVFTIEIEEEIKLVSDYI
ncbi:TPA: putative phage abortive infection protein [Photobacterium damselae]